MISDAQNAKRVHQAAAVEATNENRLREERRAHGREPSVVSAGRLKKREL